MKKTIYTYLSIYLSIFLLLTQICVQKVSASGGSFGDDAFINNGSGSYYIVDTSDLPTGTNFYYKYADGYCDALPSNKVITYTINAMNGLAMNAELIGHFITDYLLYGDLFKTARETVHPNFIYTDINDATTVIGYALNDITGCVYRNNAPSDTNVTVPSEIGNDVYNYLDDWIQDNNYDEPDYINFNTQTTAWAKNHVNLSNNYASAYNTLLQNLSGDFKIVPLDFYGEHYLNSYIYLMPSLSGNILYYQYQDYHPSWSGIVDTYGLDIRHNVVNVVDMLTYNNTLPCYAYDTTNLQVVTAPMERYEALYNGNYEQKSNERLYIGGCQGIPISDTMQSVTVWKDAATMQKVVNNTYAPNIIYSQRYYDYNSTSTDNSSTTTNNNIDSSVTTNETIYNNSSESFTEYYSENNYQIDNSVVINYNDTIINNYYPPDNGDDNGGGSGGGGSGSDDDDSGILDKLLDAIVGFFKAIGKIIAALLTGLFELLNTILNALAEINNSFEGIKNFLASIFAWFPSSIVSLMVLGLGLALLASFITWFKK